MEHGVAETLVEVSPWLKLGLGVFFIIIYYFITREHQTGVTKENLALGMGAIIWVVISVAGALNGPILKERLDHAIIEIADIVFFLLMAMSLVEVATHYRFFDWLRGRIYHMGLNSRMQFVIICVLSFFLSAIIDNLTTTIVMITAAVLFFRGRNVFVMVSAIVILANAGGAWSPLGDVTTIMLWLADKFNASEVVFHGFLPSMTMATVAVVMLLPSIQEEQDRGFEGLVLKLQPSEWVVIALCAVSFVLPFVMTQLHLPPWVGLGLGLGVVGIAIETFKRKNTGHNTHMNASILNAMRQTELLALVFFMGVLLAVKGLDAVGVLREVSGMVYGDQSFWRLVLGHSVLGVLSAVVDNVPLTAVVIDMIHVPDHELWVFLALTVGTGGSLLVVGSAAGIVAMNKVKGLTFDVYRDIALKPVIVSYLAMIGVWLAQYWVFQ